MPYTDSVPDEGGIALQGVWLHDPLDPEGTVRQYLYGRAARAASIDVEIEGSLYAGRTHAVFDYGEHQEDGFTVRMDIPVDADLSTQLQELKEFAESRRTLFFRDNRGRAAYGALSDYSEDDTEWGTSVSFRFTRSDHETAVV